MIKPKRLEKGNTIKIISPSSGLWKRSDLWRGIETLESWGFHVKTGSHAYRNYFYLAGTDEERAEDFNNAFRDDGVDAVFCSQGGYGAGRILNMIDYEAIKKSPKILLGYSDITALHLAIQKKCGLVTFHGPTVSSFYGSGFTEYREKMLKKALMSDEPIGNIAIPDKKDGYVLKLTPGRVSGQLIGGNLTLICASLGTPYEIDTKDKIFFIEDLDTEPWIFDHMLTHLLNAGKFQQAKGIIVGECSNCEPFKYDAGFPNQCSIEDLLFDRLAPLGIPLVYGLPIGHIKNLCTVPEGVVGTLDATNGTFSIDESGTVCN